MPHTCKNDPLFDRLYSRLTKLKSCSILDKPGHAEAIADLTIAILRDLENRVSALERAAGHV